MHPSVFSTGSLPGDLERSQLSNYFFTSHIRTKACLIQTWRSQVKNLLIVSSLLGSEQLLVYISCTHVHFLQTSKGSFEKTKNKLVFAHTNTHIPTTTTTAPPKNYHTKVPEHTAQHGTAMHWISLQTQPCWMIEVELSRISSVIKVHEVRRFSKEGPRSEDLLWAAVCCMKECVCTFCPQRLDLFRASSSVWQ